MSLTGFSKYPSRMTPTTFSSDMDTFLSEMPTLITEINNFGSACKAWCVCGVTGNILASQNITSVADSGTGCITVTIDTDFSSANYVIVAIPEVANNSNDFFCNVVGTPSAGSFVVYCHHAGVGLADPERYFIACFGN
jgi:monoamine oxidase